MIKRLFFTLLILFLGLPLLSSCSNSEQQLVNEYIVDTDYPYMFHPESSNARITVNDKGYYLLNGHYIYFMDKQSNNPVLLDNRPDNECMKADKSGWIQSTDLNDENCNAYVPLLSDISVLFQSYQGSLYTIEYKYSTEVNNSTNEFETGEYELVKRDADGSKRKVLRTFHNANIAEAGIHRDYLYYSVEDRDKENHLNYQILRLSLKKLSKEPEVMYTGKLEEGSISRMIPYGSQIYFLEWPGNDMFRVMRYDLNSSSATILWEQKDGGYPNMEAIHKDQLYFWYYFYNNRATENSDILDERGLKIYTSDLDGSNIRKTSIQSSPIISKIFMDDSYTYVRPVWFQLRGLSEELNIKDEMKIYKDDDLIHTVDTSHLSVPHDIYTGDERYMFVQGWDDNVDFVQILDKNEIESGKATFKTILETPME